jgi:hypothetical protein
MLWIYLLNPNGANYYGIYILESNQYALFEVKLSYERATADDDDF